MSAIDPNDTGHEYDGIHEHDNKLPRWWLFTLYGAIGFAFVYWLTYHVFEKAPLPRQVYEKDLAVLREEQAKRDAELLASLTDDVMLKMKDDPAVVASGQATYMASCLPCHGPQGQGLVGPNLTDEFWIHGGKPTDALRTISDGVPAKGMPTWKPVLGTTKVRDVAVFLLTMHNTHAAGGKAPEGLDDSGRAPATPSPTPSTP